jgi:hypothetical protein
LSLFKQLALSLLLCAVSIAQTTTTLTSGQTIQLNAPTVTWSLNPAGIGTVSSTGLYTAPATNPAQQSVIVSATDGGQTIFSQVITLRADTITMPIEVVGANGTTVPVNFGIPTGASVAGPLTLSMQVNNLTYQTEMSIELNQGPWIPISTPGVTLLDHYAVQFGGIGGGFSTLNVALPLAPGSVTAGSNQIRFRFNSTDGVASGFRVLAFNIANSTGNLIPASVFIQDNPAYWTPPLNNPADIAAGLAAFQAENTLKTQMAGPTPNIKAACADCHAQDGRDLKYFNYSNNSIVARAMFHGLSQQQGLQIASYIRSLTTPSPGRVWNPPYQPGPGLDAGPVQNWSAGAGLSAVLAADTIELASLQAAPAQLAHEGYLNQRETQIFLQLKDWNHWLPTVWPGDAFPAANFSYFQNGYLALRNTLIPNNAAVYAKARPNLIFLSLPLSQKMFETITPGGLAPNQDQSSPLWQNPLLAQEIYSFGLWGMVKTWDLNQTFGLEAMASAAFNANPVEVAIPANTGYRAWFSNQAFFTSPNFLGIPHGNPGLDNGTVGAFVYDSFVWYQLQLILNDGNGTAQGTWPIDRGYVMAFLYNSLTWQGGTAITGDAGLMLEWLAKVLQSGDVNDAQPLFTVFWPAPKSSYADLTTAQRTAFITNWTTNWFNYMKTLTPAQVFSATGATATYNPAYLGSFTGDLANVLPALQYYGVPSALLMQITTWASGLWPAFNWAGTLAETCVPGGSAYLNLACK